MKSLLTTLLLITGISMAQQLPSIPHKMSFQAMITDTLGNPVTDGTHNFTFRINRPTQAGQIQTIWEETKQVAVVDGLISTILGSVNPIGFIPFSDNYFLRVALDNEVISVSPLTSVPFAFNASRAMGANHATHADTAHFTHHAMHADTAHFVMNAPMSDTSHFAHQAGHAEHADTSNFTHQANHSEHADTATYALNIIGNDDSQDSTFETRFIDYTFSLSNDAEIFGVTVQELLGTSMTYGTITLLDIENFICNDCDASDSYSFSVMSYDNSYQGTGSPPNSQSIAYEYAGNTNTFYSSGYHITINPTTSLLKIRSNNHATSGTLKLLVSGLFDD